MNASVLPQVAELFAAHAPLARRLLRRFGVPEADVPDACQDVFVVVQRKLPEFEGRAPHRSWICGICVRVAADYRKRAHRRYERLGDPTGSELGGLSHHTRPDPALVRRAQRALAQLDEDKRRVFVLHELEELTMPEVAAALGCPLKTAFSRFYSARKALQAELESERGRMGAIAAFCFGRETLNAEVRAALDRAASLDPWPLLTPQPIVASASLLTPAVMHAVAVLTLATTAAVQEHVAPHGATLVAMHAAPRSEAFEPAPRHVRYMVTPRVEVVEPAPARAPAIKRRVRAIPLAAPVTAAPQVAASAWLVAPEGEPPQPKTTPTARSADLDEVLSATSIRSSMRFGPSPDRAPAAWELILQRGRQ